MDIIGLRETAFALVIDLDKNPSQRESLTKEAEEVKVKSLDLASGTYRDFLLGKATKDDVKKSTKNTQDILQLFEFYFNI